MMNFEDITLKIEQINSIAYALEGAMIEAEGHGPDDKELLTHPVYSLKNEIRFDFPLNSLNVQNILP